MAKRVFNDVTRKQMLRAYAAGVSLVVFSQCSHDTVGSIEKECSGGSWRATGRCEACGALAWGRCDGTDYNGVDWETFEED